MEHKIVFTGTMGAGKTTAIGHISEIEPVATDVANTRPDEHAKATTTAAFDYGELDLGDGETLRLYGTPGQERFSFMWPVLARGALGIVYLVDDSRTDPLADLARFLDAFGDLATQIPSVVAINRVAGESAPPVELFQDYLEQRGLPWPAVEVDARERAQVLDTLEILLGLSEADTAEMSP